MEYNILDTAKEVLSERGEAYGSAQENYDTIAALWSAFLGFEVKPRQVVACMILVKLSRLKKTPSHEDSVLDIAGYSEIYSRLSR